MNIQFRGRTIEISEGKRAYWLMDAEYHKCLKSAEDKFKNNYKSTGNLKNLLDKFWDIVEIVEIESYQMLSDMLKKYGGLGFSSEEFYSVFGEKFEAKFERYEKELITQYNQLVDAKEEKYQYRRDRKAYRRRWYGFTKEGQNKAAVKNMESYMWHSTKNLVGNAMTATATSIKMASVFNDKKRMNLMCADIKALYSEIRKSLYTTMQNQSKYPFQAITNADVDSANQYMEEAKKHVIDSEENINAILKALETHPGMISIYQYIIESYGDEEKQFENLAGKFGINVEEWKVSKLKEKLKVSTPKDLSDEGKIFAAIEFVKTECRFWGIETTEYIKDLQDKWRLLDKKLRTVENVEYQTREESDKARADVKFLEGYSAAHNLLEEDVEELCKSILPNLQCETTKKNIKYHVEQLKKSQDIRNIQNTSERITSYFVAYEKIKKCFAYGHIFSQKIGYERFIELFDDNKKVAFIYDTAAVNKGNNGLLLTSTSLYYYQAQEIKEIPLNKYNGMQVRAGKIYIQIEGEEELNTGLDVNVDQLDYNFFAEMFDKVVRMCKAIKNTEEKYDDTEVYDNVIVRSKQAEFVRHNKLIVAIVIGVIVFFLAIVLVTITSDKKESATIAENTKATEDAVDTEVVNEIEDASDSEIISEQNEWISPVDTSASWNIYYGEEIINFLNNSDSGCWYVNGNGEYTYHGVISGLEAADVEPYTYTIVDMDGDSKPEVVIELLGELDGYYLIIHYNDQSEDSSIYAVTCNHRSLTSLQVNGVCSGSSGADTYVYYLYDFEPERNCHEIELANAEGEQYFIQSTPVSHEEFDAYYQNTLAADLVEWRDYSLTALAEELGANVPDNVSYMESETGEYILEGSDQYLLDWFDLEGLTAEECKIARNEIYARYGRKFNDAELQAHFDSCSWYEGFIEGEDFNEDWLSEVEKANRDLIIEYETEMGYR